MCYLPKATFYLYFGFFFAGYLWIFGILFLNFWEDSSKSGRHINAAIQPLMFNDSKLIFSKSDFASKLSDDQLEGCVSVSAKPAFKLCLSHNMRATNLQQKELELCESLSNAFRRVANKNALFLDIGASTGYSSMCIAAQGYTAISFEHNPQNSVLLQKSTVLNSLQSRVTVVRALASNQAATAIVQADAKSTNHKSHKVHTVRVDNVKALGKDSFPVYDMIANAPVIIVRLQLNGQECLAVQGCAGILSHVAYVFMDWVESRRSASAQCFNNMVNELKQRFTPVTLQWNKIKESDLYSKDAPYQLVWVKS